MRFRIGLLLGGAIGYVLGARAGHARYEQIKRWAARARKHPAVAQIVDQVLGATDAGRYGVAAALSAGARSLKAAESGIDPE